VKLTMYDRTLMCKVEVKVDDGIVIKSVHNKDMKVTHLVLTYAVDGDQWIHRAVTVQGYRLKQDGTVGLKADEAFFGWPQRYPSWVEQAAEHYRPKAAAPMAPAAVCELEVEDEA
jgi:hypothetical protein